MRSRHTSPAVLLAALLLVLGVLVPAAALRAQSGSAQEAYAWSTLGIAGAAGDGGYTDRFAGDDMLPYTADDIDLPARGNTGGTWGFSHFDIDGDDAIDENEHIFNVIRRDDDDIFGFAILSRPDLGVLYEAEDWIDYHNARNEGPSKTTPGDLQNEGDDFEHNDRPNWEDQTNAYPYNNAVANQHGKGKSRYYFEHINPERAAEIGEWTYDEVEGYVKTLGFQNNLDDPETPLNEEGPCRNSYMQSVRAVTRGYLIPVEDIAGLADGSLQTLFGWETVDLAAWFRDDLGPKLDDPGLGIFSDNVDQELPPTHVMLLQIETPITINEGGACADPATAQALADYWGLPATGATYRVSHLLGFNADSHEVYWSHPDRIAAGVHYWTHELPDGGPTNLWLIDYFFRDDPAYLGNWTTSGASWSITADPAFAVIESTTNRILATNGPGAVAAAVARPLGTNELPMALVVDLAEGVLGPDDPGGDDIEVVHQIILEGPQAGEVVAYAEIRRDGTSVCAGGALDAGGMAGGGGACGNGSATQIAEVSLGEFTRFALLVDAASIRLVAAPAGAYEISDFAGFDAAPYVELARLDAAIAGAVTGARIATSGLGGPLPFFASLDAQQEVPAPDLGDPPAAPYGDATFELDPRTGELTYHITISGLTSEETAAHIHKARPGEIGNPIESLPSGDTKTGSFVMSAEEIDALFAGELYVNVHTEQNTPGEIRGQIQASPISGRAVALNLVALLAAPPAAAPQGVGPFLRGDSNADGEVNISDASFTLNFLFLGGPEPDCRASTDANGDGSGDISDASFALNFLFLGGPDPKAPFPACAISADPGDVLLDCLAPPACAP